MGRYDRKPTRRSVLDETNVAIWGVGGWASAYCWGRGDPQQQPLTVDRYDGMAYWGRHCWATDFWTTW